MAEKQEIRARDVVTLDGFRLWMQSLPDDYEFMELNMPTVGCALAKFAKAVWPRGHWVATGTNLVNFLWPGDLTCLERISDEWTWIVPQIFDKAIRDRDMDAPVTVAQLKVLAPELFL